MIHAEPVALRVAIGKQAALQHLVRREPYSRHDVGRIESRLLDLGKIILRVPVQFHNPHLNEREIFFRPDFGKVERIELALVGRILFRVFNLIVYF
jgi:hypothetical protein